MVASAELLNWLVAFRHPADIWEKHYTYLIGEVVYYFLTLLTFRHALRSGGRYVALWFTTILHGLVVESVSYFVPDIDNFWHAQSMIMFLGKRLPLHIIFFYPVFLYTAAVAVSRLHLRRLPASCAMGLAVVLLDVPFDIMGIKLLWWTWHDTDPNVYDRHYWVPWTSYYFHAAFASSFYFLFFGTRGLVCNTERFQADGFFKELFCSTVTGLLSMPLGVVQFIPVYHVLHDLYDLHTEVCVLLFLASYALIVWAGDRQPTNEARSQSRGWFDEISLHVLLHYTLYALLVVFAKPEIQTSTGVHEPIGNCKDTTSMYTALGQIVTKKKYLCPTDYDEGYFDFSCAAAGGKAPRGPDGNEWYTICGNPYPNHVEYMVVVVAFCVLGLFCYIQMLAYSGRQIRTLSKPTKLKTR